MDESAKICLPDLPAAGALVSTETKHQQPF